MNDLQSIQNSVLDYVPKEVTRQGEVEKAGTYICIIGAWQAMHSRINWDLTPKVKLPEFSDPTPELGVMFSCSDGVIFNRYHLEGYLRWEQLSEKQRESGKFHKVVFGQQVYACKMVRGKLVRIEDPKKTEGAENIINRFFTVAGKSGVKTGQAMKEIVDEKVEFRVKVEIEYYEGKPQVKVKSVDNLKPVVAGAVEDESEDDFGS